MIQITHDLPKKVYVACSGGLDSMVVIDFLSRRHDVEALFFHHGNELADREYEFVKHNVHCTLDVKFNENTKKASESEEEFWRNSRYQWFHSLPVPVITCHHLDDCVETWVWSSMHGEGKIIPASNGNVIRPFRLNKKTEFEAWATKNNLVWFEDPSNQNTKHMRNYIRHELMPKILTVNPGIHKVIRKKIINEQF